MNKFIIVFAICIIILLIIIFFIPLSHKNKDSEEEFLDENGNHIYYERSLIRKQRFIRKHPEIKPQDLRSFKRLLKKDPSSK